MTASKATEVAASFVELDAGQSSSFSSNFNATAATFQHPMSSTAAASKPLVSHHIVAASAATSPSEPPVRWRTATKHSPTDPSGGANSSAPRKPSYVGLSCSVSGYSPSNRYTSPDGRRTSPEQIPVSQNPQTLDSVNLVLDSMRQQQQQQANNNNHKMSANGHDVTDRAAYYASSSSSTTTTTRVFSSTYREVSPGSDSGSSGVGAGPLVQKQIERIYGGKAQSVRATSPPVTSPDEASEEDATPQRKSSGGGFFSKRFGLSKQKDRQSVNDKRLVEEERSRNGAGDSSPLDFKPLKVPAVFRLLRPEFREQLKSNSCQIPGDRTSPVKEPRQPTSAAAADADAKRRERVIPLTVENGSKAETKERVIPIQKTSEKFLPEEVATSAGGVANTKPSKLNATPAGHAVTSPGLVMSSGIAPSPKKVPAEQRKEPEPSPSPPPKKPDSPVGQQQQQSPRKAPSPTKSEENGNGVAQPDSILEVEEEEEEEELDDISPEDFDPAAVGGIHERTQLGTILEEDNESTASGSQLNLAKTNGNGTAPAPTAAKRSAARNGDGVGAAGRGDAASPQQEVRDGHYFIKVRKLS